MSLADRVAAPDYLDRIVNVSERIAGVTEQAAVQWLLNEGIAALGAQSAVFVNFVRDKVEVSSCRFMLACDPAWCRQFLAAGLIAHDPWMAYAAHHSEPALAKHLAITRPEEMQVMELASRSGFASAVLDGPGFGRFKLGARALAGDLHDWWVARIRHELMVNARITQGDLELLRHQCQGHSSKRIAAELHVSRSSINSRFQRMNSKLGVPNRRMAARLATECGLLVP